MSLSLLIEWNTGVYDSWAPYKHFCDNIPKKFKKECEDRMFGDRNWKKENFARMVVTGSVAFLMTALFF